MRKNIFFLILAFLALTPIAFGQAEDHFTFSPAFNTYTDCNDECIACSPIDYYTNTELTGHESYTSGLLQSKIIAINDQGQVTFTIRKCTGNFVQGNTGKIFVLDIHDGSVCCTPFEITNNSTRTLTAEFSFGWDGYGMKVFEIYYYTENQNNKIFAGSHTLYRLHQYTVSTSVNIDGAGYTYGGGTYAEGSSCTVTADTYSGYTFSHWTKDGSTVSYNTSYTFTVTGDHNLVANYTPITHTVTGVCDPTEAGVILGNLGTQNHGTDAYLTGAAYDGYRFDYWTTNRSSAHITSNPVYFTVNEDITYYAHFSPVTHTVTGVCSPTNAGVILGNLGTQNHGTNAYLTGAAYDNYRFDYWTTNLSSAHITSNPVYFTVNEDITYYAHFSPVTHTVTGVCDPSNAGVILGNLGTQNQGTNASLTASPYSNYTFNYWTTNLSSTHVTSNPVHFTVTDDIIYYAHFTANRYNVYVYANNDNYGTVSGGGTYDAGSSVTIAATPNSGYHFAQWEDGITDNPRTFTLTQDVTLSANFASDFVFSDAAETNLIGYTGPGGNITIPATTVTIAANVFRDNSTITAVTVPASVTSIGSNAFHNCSNLTSVNYTGTVAQWCAIDFVTVYSNPVSQSHSLSFNGSPVTNLVIPQGVTEIKKYAFYDLTSMNSISFPNTLTTLGDAALYRCSGLTSITIPTSLTTIENNAFYSTSSISQTFYEGTLTQWCGITFGNSFSNPMISSKNLYINNESIINLVIPEGVTELKDYAFFNLTFALPYRTVTIPSTITTIGSNVIWGFGGVNSLTKVYFNATNCTSIGQHGIWFRSNTNDTLILGDNVTNIPANLVTTHVTHLTIGAGITSLDDNALKEGRGLQVLTMRCEPPTLSANALDSLPANVQIIVPCGTLTAYQAASGWSNFSNNMSEETNCTHTVNVGVDDNNAGTVIGGGDYNDGATVTLTVTASCGHRFVRWSDGNTDNPRTITVTGDINLTAEFEAIATTGVEVVCSTGQTLVYSINCNTGNATLTGHSGTCTGPLAIPDTITVEGHKFAVREIGYSAFFRCNGLTSVTIPATVTSVSNYAFHSCSGLTSLTLPSSLRYADAYSFYGCSGLTSLTIPAALTSIGDGAFRGCSGLTTITVEAGNGTYDSRDNCNAIVRTSDNTLVQGCNTTVIPNNIATIGDYAFIGCSGMTTQTIPASVTAIGSCAFNSCSGLTALTVLPATPPTVSGNAAFSDIPVDIPVTVPCRTAAAYQTANGWIYFTNIQEAAGCSHTVTVLSDNPAWGTVSGGGTYSDGSRATVTATAADGYHFVRWDDGNADNPRLLLVNSDITLTATFAPSVGTYEIRCCTGQTLRFAVDDNTHTATVIGYVGQCTGGLVVPAWFSVNDERYTVTVIGSHAFQGCTGLVTVTLPNTIVLVDEYAFQGCTGLITVDIR